MRLIPVNSLRPGMKLGRKIYNEHGVVLLSDNAELTESVIRRLRSYGLEFVYIADPRTDDIVIQDVIEDETRRHALLEIRTNFRKMTDNSFQSLTYPHLGKSFMGVVESILDDITSREDAMIMMMNIDSVDHYLYRHSLNVCVYTLLLGQIYGYSKEDLIALGLGAMLHDIGKTKLPLELLNKPSELNENEYNLMKQHTLLGFQLLKDEPGIPLKSAHCALQHHERINGSGYPRGIKGNEISEFARLLMIADAYDAMTTHRVYRPAMLPHQALEVLYTGCGEWYEKSKLELFRDHVAIYPLGMSVKLSTGEEGVVVNIHRDVPHRPVVRILTDPIGVDLKTPYDLDLGRHLSVVVTEVDNAKRNMKMMMTQ